MGGLGLKKFSLVNQAMISKQFWRIQKFPNSLQAKTFKDKYFPRSSLQGYKLIPSLLDLEKYLCATTSYLTSGSLVDRKWPTNPFHTPKLVSLSKLDLNRGPSP